MHDAGLTGPPRGTAVSHKTAGDFWRCPEHAQRADLVRAARKSLWFCTGAHLPRSPGKPSQENVKRTRREGARR